MAFDDKTITAVWEKGWVMDAQNPDLWRKDQCGAWIRKDQYEKEDSEFCWKIINISPGGDDSLDNLSPFHRDNDFSIPNGQAQCRVKADRADHEPEQQLDAPRNIRA